MLLAALLGATALLMSPQQPERPGYRDTPKLPDGFHVHDSERAYPKVVTPGPAGEPVAPPQDAIVLFDGKSLEGWTGKDGKAAWTVADGCMTVNGTGDIRTVRSFGDCQLHVEWSAPAVVAGNSQGRGNSGVFFFERYEVQVLDSFDNATYADGQAAAIYGQYPPLVNCCRRPGEWQTYDIVFVAPRFDEDGRLVQPARATVLHNGILVHLDRELLGQTAHRSMPAYRPHEPRGPIKLQDHGNPVRYRNLWVRELDLQAAAALPAAGQPARGGH